MGITNKLRAMLSAEPQTIEASGGPTTGGGKVSRDKPPKDDYRRYRRLYRTHELIPPAIDLRATEKVRPGYRVEADDDIKEDLEEWAETAAFYSGERGEDLSPLLWQVARDLDLDGTVLVEAVWDDPENPTTLEGVKQFDPAQTDFLTAENSALLPPADPDDLPTDEDGARIDHGERTKSDKVAAYLQYPDGWGFDRNQVFLSQDDVFKLTRSPGFGDGRGYAGPGPQTSDYGPNRGVSLVEAVADEAEREMARSQDHNASIAAHAYPRLKATFSDYERGNQVVAWDRTEMASFMGKVTREGDEKKYSLNGDWTDPGGSVASPPGVDVELIQGDVPDVINSMHYSVDKILSGLRVPKALIGFGEDLNRDILEDQTTVFEQDTLQGRRQMERKLLDRIFKMKARELRGSGPFDDSVDVSDVTGRLEPEEAENPLKDDEFDPDEFGALVDGVVEIMDSSAEVHFGGPDEMLEFVGDLINMDMSEYVGEREDAEDALEQMGAFDDGFDADIDDEEGEEQEQDGEPEPPEPPLEADD